MMNPDQGYIATANNRVVRPDYPINIELEPISGDRAQRIAEMILDTGLRSGQEKIDMDYIKHMQFDLTSPSARVILRYLVQLPLDVSVHKPETDLHAALKLLKEWDGTLSADSSAAVIYQVFTRMFVHLVLKDKLDPPEGNRNRIKTHQTHQPYQSIHGKGPTPVLAEVSLFSERWLPWLTRFWQNRTRIGLTWVRVRRAMMSFSSVCGLPRLSIYRIRQRYAAVDLGQASPMYLPAHARRNQSWLRYSIAPVSHRRRQHHHLGDRNRPR
jgi:hypothetical protein